MIAAAPILTELYLSAAAVVGLAVLYRILTRRDAWDPINRRFLFAIKLTLALFIGRVLLVSTGIEAFRILILAAAGAVPLGVLLLTEGLLRRHAPFVFKALIGAGTAGFLLSSFWYSDSIDPQRLYALMIFQVLSFGAAGWMVVSRKRDSLSDGENAMVVRLGLSLILLIPMVFGDFMLMRVGLPVQLSAIGVLILCWLAIGLGRASLGHRASLMSLAGILGTACIVGGMIVLLSGIGRDGAILIIAILMATLLALAVIQDARALRREERSLGLLRHLADAKSDHALAFLRELRDHPDVAGAAIIDADSLAELQAPVLHQIFKAAPVLRKSDPPALGEAADDHITHLFERYAATHIMVVSQDPWVLVALSMPSLRASPVAELELQVVQRMASLMPYKEE